MHTQNCTHKAWEQQAPVKRRTSVRGLRETVARINAAPKRAQTLSPVRPPARPQTIHSSLETTGQADEQATSLEVKKKIIKQPPPQCVDEGRGEIK